MYKRVLLLAAFLLAAVLPMSVAAQDIDNDGAPDLYINGSVYDATFNRGVAPGVVVELFRDTGGGFGDALRTDVTDNPQGEFAFGVNCVRALYMLKISNLPPSTVGVAVEQWNPIMTEWQPLKMLDPEDPDSWFYQWYNWECIFGGTNFWPGGPYDDRGGGDSTDWFDFYWPLRFVVRDSFEPPVDQAASWVYVSGQVFDRAIPTVQVYDPCGNPLIAAQDIDPFQGVEGATLMLERMGYDIVNDVMDPWAPPVFLGATGTSDKGYYGFGLNRQEGIYRIMVIGLPPGGPGGAFIVGPFEKYFQLWAPDPDATTSTWLPWSDPVQYALNGFYFEAFNTYVPTPFPVPPCP
jgi:hypothetical protein